MMLRIAAFEWRCALRTPSTYLYLLVYSLLGGLWTLAYVGAVPGMSISMGSEKLLVNSPYVLHQVIALVGIFGIFTVGGIMGRAGIKDFTYGSEALLFSKPISRYAYLGGRFLGGFGVLLFVFAGVPLGAWAAVHSGIPTADLIGPDSMGAYLVPQLFSVWPNLFAGGAFFFALTALTRRMTAVYVGSAVLLLGWLIASNFSAQDGGAGSLYYALLDPSGIFAADRQTIYWSLLQKNGEGLSLSGVFLWNRLLWLGFGCCALALVFGLFSTAATTRRRSRKGALPETDTDEGGPVQLHPVTPVFNGGTYRLMWWRITRLEVRAVLGNRYFAAILTCAVLFMVMNALQMGALMGMRSFPVTYQVLDQLGPGFGLFVLMLIAFYSGEMVHRERDLGMDQLYDALPMPNWVPYTAKAGGLALLVLALLGVVFLSGVTIQLLRGWTELNLSLYAVDLLVVRFSHLLLICVLALFVHVALNHKQLGHLVMILYFLGNLAAVRLGLEHPLLVYGRAPQVPWSDMNGYGAALAPHLAYKLYWGIFALIPLLLSLGLWMRGTTLSIGSRFRRLRQMPGLTRSLTAIAVLWSAVGAFLFYQGNVVDRFESRKADMAKAAALERNYGDYGDLPSFSVDHVDYQIDLFASEGRLETAGRYLLENRHDQPLARIVLHAGDFLRFSKLAPEGAHEREVYDPELGFYVFTLAEPVPPGGSTAVSFAYSYQRAWLPARRNDRQFYRNGAYLDGGFFPQTGFPRDRLLTSSKARTRFDLPERVAPPGPDEPGASLRSGMVGDTTWTSIRARVSTDGDQIAMVPAPLITSEEKDGRRIATFDSGEEKDLFFPSLVSARYTVARDRWNGVALEIYHHPGHDANLERMMDGLKATLAYCEAAYGPYPRNFIRILEFPRHKRIARSLAGTIPFSEALGFIAEVNEGDPVGVDYPFFVTAHETAHQWWPHQVLPADAKGANMLSESLAQYTALRVMQRAVGREGMRPMLQRQRHLYLKERADLDGAEPVLAEVEEESFVYYYKGGLALYTLADRIGEESVNEALRRYLSTFAGREDRFPVSTDFIGLLRETTPSRHHYLIEDFFEHVTLHDLRLDSAERVEGRLVVRVSGKKLRAGGLGAETEVPLNDEVELGFFDGAGHLVGTERVWLEAGGGEFVFEVGEEVERVVLDPFYATIDRNLDDNRRRPSEKSSNPTGAREAKKMPNQREE